jgi:hypothetical protein
VAGFLTVYWVAAYAGANRSRRSTGCHPSCFRPVSRLSDAGKKTGPEKSDVFIEKKLTFVRALIFLCKGSYKKS